MNKFNFKMLIDESRNGNIAVICGRTQAVVSYYYREACNFLKCNPIYTTEIAGYYSAECAIKFKKGGCVFFCSNTSNKLIGIHKQFEIYEVTE